MIVANNVTAMIDHWTTVIQCLKCNCQIILPKYILHLNFLLLLLLVYVVDIHQNGKRDANI